MLFSKKIKTISFSAFLIILLLSVPKLSQIGFMLSEYLSKQPRVNYIFAIALSMFGFSNSYLQLTTDENLTLNRAIRAYLTFGFGMSGIYYLVYISHIGCFSLPSDIAENASIIDFIYFSFITITTVGYGDIAPLHTFVRALVLIQVLFATILVFRISKSNKETV